MELRDNSKKVEEVEVRFSKKVVAGDSEEPYTLMLSESFRLSLEGMKAKIFTHLISPPLFWLPFIKTIEFNSNNKL